MHKQIIGAAVVSALVFGGVGFWGGSQYAKSAVPERGMFVAGGQFGGGRSMRSAGSFVSGEIVSTDQSSFTLKMQDGSTKIVLLGASTTVSEMTQAPASSLKVGAQVVVTGATNSDGSLSAQMVQLRPTRR